MNQMNRSYFWAWDDHKGWNYTSYFSFFNDFHRDDEDMKYVELASLVILSVISVIINVFLIMFIAKSRHLHSQQNMYTVNVLASSLLILPVALLVGLTRLSPSGWQFGDFACRTSLVLYVTTAFIKIWLMTLIGVDKYLKIVHLPKYHIGRQLSIVLTVAAWILPTVTWAAVVYTNSETKDVLLENEIIICSIQFDYHPTMGTRAPMYFATIFVFEFVFPAAIMISSYTLIMRKIRKSYCVLAKHTNINQSQLMGQVQNDDQSKSVVQNINESECSRNANGRNILPATRKHTSIEKRTTQILITILALFLVMWMPLFAMLAALSFDNHKLETWKQSSRWVVGQLCVLVLNTVIEPVLLSLTTGQVRQELVQALRARTGNSFGTTDSSNV